MPQLLPPPLVLPSAASTATISPALPTSTFAAPPVVVLSSSLFLRCGGGLEGCRAPVAALAEDVVEADLRGVDLCLRRHALPGLLHLDDADRVALVVLLSFLINDDIVIFIISLDYLERARALPLETTQGR